MYKSIRLRLEEKEYAALMQCIADGYVDSTFAHPELHAALDRGVHKLSNAWDTTSTVHNKE